MNNNLDTPQVQVKRQSIDTDELVKRIHASKPKSGWWLIEEINTKRLIFSN